MTPSEAPLIQLTNLTIRREEVTILRDVNWRVKRGEHWVILGGNGSGKTTLLSALSGYFMPSEGKIDLLGKQFGEDYWPTLRRKVGLVSSYIGQMMDQDETALNSVVTGKYGMINFWGEPNRSDLVEAGKLLNSIGCGHLTSRAWALLSQGERQKVLIGRALMARPKLLLLDEPCAGLDPPAREEFLHLIDKMGKTYNGPTLVLVTHHVEEIMPVFSHVLLMRDGSVLACGSKSKVMTTGLIGETFGSEVSLKKNRSRYRLDL